MPRFFMAGTNIKGGMAIMTGRDAEHVHVLRLRPGEDMIICDGQGTDYKCRLVKADKEQVGQDRLHHPEIRGGRGLRDPVLPVQPLRGQAG